MSVILSTERTQGRKGKWTVRPFSRNPEGNPSRKEKVARKKKSPQRTITAGGDSKQWKAKLSFLKSKFLQKRRTGLTSQPEFSPGAENRP